MTVKNILNFLNINQKEYSKIFLLLIQSVFIGIFISFYYSFANGLFLKTFSIKYLPIAYIASGFFGFIASFAFSKAQKNYNLSNLILGLFFVLVLILFSFIILLNFIVNQQLVIFIIFISFIPISTLTAIGFGAMTIKFFDLRQGKRLFSIISSGEVISSFIAFITIPIILSIFKSQNDDTSILLYFSIIGITLAFIFQLYINRKFKNLFLDNVTVKKKKISIRVIIENKYYLSIILLSLISFFSFMLIDFSFLDFSRNKFSDKTSLTSFLGLFFALIKFSEFVFKTFISGRLIEKYGLNFGLGLLPIVLFPITLLILLGLLFDFTNNVIFIFIAINMFFLIILKKSFEDPTFNLLFQPLDSSIKSSVQTIVLGKARLFGMILSGIVLLLFNSFQNKIFIITLSLLTVLIFWFLSVLKVNQNFRKLIASLLKSRKGLSHFKFTKVNYLHSLQLLINEGNDFIHKHFTNNLIPWFEVNELLISNTKDNQTIEELIQSKNLDDQYEAICRINKTWNEKYLNFLFSMVLDQNEKLSQAALVLLSNRGVHGMHIDNYLNSIVNTSFSVPLFFLLSKADNVIETVVKIDNDLLLNSDNKTVARLNEILLIQVISEKQNPIYNDFFLTKLRNADSEIETYLLKGLSIRNVEFNLSQKVMLRSKLELEAQYFSWLLASILDINILSEVEELSDLLSEELSMIKNRLFLILSILYDADEINQIQSALLGNEENEMVLAIEMLENILDKNIKDFIIPIFENLDTLSQYKKMIHFFPQEKMTARKRLENIINHDFRRSIDLIRVSAIRVLENLHKPLSKAIVANIFNKNDIIKEAAYISLYNNDKKKYSEYFDLEQDRWIKEKLDTHHKEVKPTSILDKINLIHINNFFENVSKSNFLKIAILADFKSEDLKESNIKSVLKNYVLFVLSGEINLLRKTGELKTFKKGDTIGLFNSILKTEDCQIKLSNNFKYFKIPFNYIRKILLSDPALVSSLLNKM